MPHIFRLINVVAYS